MSPARVAMLPVPIDPPPGEGVLRHLGLDGCVRLPIAVDVARLRRELDALPAAAWGKADRDPVVNAYAESFFCIGHPRGPRPLPPEDRPVMQRLPYLRALLREAVPAAPARGIVARLRAHGFIPIHTDTPRYFRSTLRLSFQVISDGAARLYCDGLWYDMAPGEVWAVDNLRPHAVHNAGSAARVNVLADYVPSDELARLVLDRGEAGLGGRDDAATREIEAMTAAHYRRNRFRSLRYEIGKMIRRRVWASA